MKSFIETRRLDLEGWTGRACVREKKEFLTGAQGAVQLKTGRLDRAEQINGARRDAGKARS